MEPGNAGAWQQLLNLALKGEDIAEVIRICTACMELFPESPEYYFYLGIALLLTTEISSLEIPVIRA